MSASNIMEGAGEFNPSLNNLPLRDAVALKVFLTGLSCSYLFERDSARLTLKEEAIKLAQDCYVVADAFLEVKKWGKAA